MGDRQVSPSQISSIFQFFAKRVDRSVDLHTPFLHFFLLCLKLFPLLGTLVEIDEIYDVLGAHRYPLTSVVIPKLVTA
jgi:hypothetical protein